MSRNTTMNRRRMLQALGASMGVAMAGGSAALKTAPARAQNQDGPYFLLVIPAFGGGAIIDSFLPLTESECTDPNRTDCFSAAEVITAPGSPIRAVDAVCPTLLGQPLPQPITVPLSPFANKHRQDMMVTTLQHTSVNHTVAQHRAITGGGSAWKGRTLQECVAATYGDGFPLPNVNMASLGYLQPGVDDSLPDFARAEAVAQPLLKPLSLSATKGIPQAPGDDLVALARGIRDDRLDPQSSFYQTFRLSDKLQRWKGQRAHDSLAVEEANLIDKLIFVKEDPEGNIPLSAYGLSSSPDADLLAQTFGDGYIADPFLTQAALAFLLLKYGVSVTVTLSPSFAPLGGGPYGIANLPLAFDGSHNDHRTAQAIMWDRILGVADKLIDLLKATPFMDGTMWDRTMIHFATDFGRDKARPDNGQPFWGTSHHLNNGTLTVSPLVNGDSVLGGVTKNDSVDTDGLTYGFNLQTGAEDPWRQTSESEHFAGLLQALKIDTSPAGLPDVPAMRHNG